MAVVRVGVVGERLGGEAQVVDLPTELLEVEESRGEMDRRLVEILTNAMRTERREELRRSTKP